MTLSVSSSSPEDYVPVGPFKLAAFAVGSDESTHFMREEFDTLDEARRRASYLESVTELEYEVIDDNLYTLPRLQ